MSLKAILFDLDGTLLPMDQDRFTKGYFELLTRKLAPLGYEPKELVDAIWKGTAEMVKNDGGTSNETVFWRKFSEILGERVMRDKPAVDEFYQKEFESAKEFCGFDAQAGETVTWAKEQGLRTALAVNPVFPMCAMCSRVRWAGLKPEDFELITAYENISVSKPNPLYFSEIAGRLELAPEECLMVGNDTQEDMAAEKCGMDVFLLTNNLINKENRDISEYPRGGFQDLREYIKEKL